ncbi:MAG TPA: galactose oxidase-like domain-containing protein, partial [Gemmatimonadales bacterium]|nr:galactose oxidase-like domain-containing protein [Gemmatimonadales bacterium]
MLARPFDLIYVCGNKFLATNTSRVPVQVTYRVVGSGETGNLTLPGAPVTDPDHTETELETVKSGAVELYQDDRQVAHRTNQHLPCGPSASSAVMAASGPETSGQWAPPFAWPAIGVHLALLPTGKAFTWAQTGEAQIWDPATGSLTKTSRPADIFCGGQSFLADGRLLVAGGRYDNTVGLGSPDVSIFDFASSTWSRSAPMARGRWYPTLTTLPSGDVLITSGFDEHGWVVEEPEVWSPTGGLRGLTGARKNVPNYPRTFVAPNGKVFYAGQRQQTWYIDPSGTGSWTKVAMRRYGVRDFGGAVMYEQGKILYVGGGRTTNTAEIIDLNSPLPHWEWTGSMAFPRRQLNTTVLPTGEVLVTSGSSGTGFNDNALAVHAAEMWNPNTGRWTVLASNSVNRTYHSTSILLPDGRILHTGGEGGEKATSRGAELFSPPYLFKGPRPAITNAPQQVTYGASFTVSTPDASNVAKVSFISLGAATHAFDMGQRLLNLTFQRGTGALTITAPASGNIAPPGYYMLFIMSTDSVPSV